MMKRNIVKKGLSLVEILVVLAIISTSMVSVITINIRSQVLIKNNETFDLASGIMLQGLELAKSPGNVDIKSAFGQTLVDPVGKYSLSTSSGAYVQYIVKQLDTDPSIDAPSFVCDNGSVYFIEVDEGEGIGRPKICAQLVINRQKRQISGEPVYQVISKLLFDTPTGIEYTEVIGYRRGGFNLNY